jgi:hypothetical protein
VTTKRVVRRPEAFIGPDHVCGPDGSWPAGTRIGDVEWRVLPGWDGEAPGVRHLGPDEWEIPARAGLDHCYRLRAPERPMIYVTEPYHVSTAEIETLSEFSAGGWDIDVRPWAAIWYPGFTIAIWCSRDLGR